MQAAAMYLEIGHGMGDDVDCIGHTDWERVGAAPGIRTRQVDAEAWFSWPNFENWASTFVFI